MHAADGVAVQVDPVQHGVGDLVVQFDTGVAELHGGSKEILKPVKITDCPHGGEGGAVERGGPVPRGFYLKSGVDGHHGWVRFGGSGSVSGE